MKEHKLANKYRKEHQQAHLPMRQLIKRLLSYVRKDFLLAGVALFFLLLARSIDAFVPIYIGYMVQDILQQSSAAQDKQQFFSIIVHQGFIVAFFLTMGYLFDTSSVVMKNWVGQRALDRLRREVVDHIQQLPLSFFDKNPVGRLITRAIHDLDQINQMFIESIIPLVGSILLFFGMTIGMVFINWRIGLVFAAIVPFVFLLAYHFQYYQHLCYSIIRNVASAMNTFIQEYLSGISTIRTFNLQTKEKGKFNELNHDNCEANMEASHHFSYFIAGIDLLQSCSLVAVFLVLIFFRSSSSSFEVGNYFTFSLYALMFFRPLIDLADRYNILQSAMTASERVFAVLDEPTEATIAVSGQMQLEEIATISFEDVWFAYEGNHWILKGLTFHILTRESVALVGVTGAGKSTIISLLLRFYEIQKGTIKINGRPLQEYSINSLRRQFSIVLQDPIIFSGSIEENIALYRKEISYQRIEEIVDHLNIQTFIDRLPNRLQYKLTERGEGLSLGEKQLIALARAVAYPHSVIVLDEATANIDSITEKMIQEALKKILKSQMALVIAHRLSTIQDVTRIIVIHQGKVAEMGSHQELLERKGLYEKLYHLQFKPNLP